MSSSAELQKKISTSRPETDQRLRQEQNQAARCTINLFPGVTSELPTNEYHLHNAGLAIPLVQAVNTKCIAGVQTKNMHLRPSEQGPGRKRTSRMYQLTLQTMTSG